PHFFFLFYFFTKLSTTLFFFFGWHMDQSRILLMEGSSTFKALSIVLARSLLRHLDASNTFINPLTYSRSLTVIPSRPSTSLAFLNISSNSIMDKLLLKYKLLTPLMFKT